jgi:glycolate oxidase iron-sulfur subunit
MPEPGHGPSSRQPTVSDCPAATGALPLEVLEKSLDCVHCGLCLSSCPTYLATGRENSSPRGRIYLMRAVAEGKLPLGELLAEESFLCVGCRACETACPSGVEFGRMLELTREAVDGSGMRDGWPRKLERFALRRVVPHRLALRTLIGLLHWAQKIGLDRLALPLLPSGLRNAHGLLPRVPSSRERRPLPELTPARGERRGAVAFFSGCVMHELFPEVNRASVEVLAANGFDVLVPPQQGCCGALQAHAGDLEYAKGLARRNVAVFGELEIDALVVNSAGCGTALREVDTWLPGDGEPLAARVRDITEFLDHAGLRPPEKRIAKKTLRVCYDDPCHLVHSQGVSSEPRSILRAIPGLELIEHADASRCCGAAGTYNLTQPELATRILAEKMDRLEEARPDIIASGNPGCLMQLRRGARERGMRARVLHPIQLLARAYSR